MKISKKVQNKISHLNFQEFGSENEASIFFLHAFPFSQHMWHEQVMALKKSFRVMTFDIRGLGKSKISHPYTLEFIVDDLIALMDNRKIKKTILCGLSMGGYVALRAVERHPERFSR